MKQIVLAMVFVMLAGVMAQAQATSVPPLVNYQGMLADADGKPLTGMKKLEFNLYDTAIGGSESKIWGPQIFSSVPLVNGMFNVILGTTDTSGKSIAEAFGAKDRYLGIKVDDGAEIAPRQQILSAPFAISSKSANDSYLVQGYDLHELIEGLKAGKVLADPSVKPGLPDADYDSGWFSVEKYNEYEKEHKLGVLPRLAVIWVATDSDGTDMCLLDNIWAGTTYRGSWLQKITTSHYVISTGYYITDSNGFKINPDGYIKVLMWK